MVAWGALATGASALASLASSGSSWLLGNKSKKEAEKANNDNFIRDIIMQTYQNQFTERMSNTAHQREVADLRKAGLNPILSATGGAGASTPTAGSASFNGTDPGNTGIQTALQAKAMFSQIEQIANDIEMKKAAQINDTKRLNNETELNTYTKHKLNQEYRLLEEQIKGQQEQNKYIGRMQEALIRKTIQEGNATESMAQTARQNYAVNKQNAVTNSRGVTIKEKDYDRAPYGRILDILEKHPIVGPFALRDVVKDVKLKGNYFGHSAIQTK